MSVPLTAEEAKRYTEIIDGILATANLETISRKKIRAGLEAALGGTDLSDQKAAIKSLIVQRFDAISTGAAELSTPMIAHNDLTSPRLSPKPEANVYPNDDIDDRNGDEIQVSTQPPKKKQRKSEDTEDADAKLAALLQAQENQLSGRATRGGGSKSKPVKKKKATPRKKSSNKVRPEDDSEMSGSEEASTKRRKAGGGFQKPFNLSAPLAEVCGGESRLSRPQVVKKLWEHIKANELQDPNDKRQIRCDEKMHAVFERSRVDMFQMNKLVGDHLFPVEEE
ncbi:SWIB/MDM2 domain protein [Xylariales sp. AK1849]|nr:SWIB/MDM2 domain protein [Xylariales sp. AK1849]